jgi:hypothetical protein
VLRQHLGDRRRQGGLAVIDVPDRPDIHVRLVALEFFLRHNLSEPLSSWSGGRDSNPRPSAWKAETLPLSYPRRSATLEPGTGIEPVTSSLPRTRSTN